MYIIISEDGTPYQAKSISETNEMACGYGYLSIINIDDLTECYGGGIWKPIRSWEATDALD